MIRNQKIVSIALCMCLIAGMMAGCGQPEAAQTSGEETRAAISVLTETPSTGDLALTTKFVGTIEPGESVYVFPKAAGEVVGTYFNVGDHVNQGDVLFAVDDSYIRLSVEAAQAQYDATEAQINQQLGSQMDLNILQAKSAYEQAKNAFRQTRDSYDDTEDSIDDGLDSLKKAIDATKPLVKDAKDEYDAAKQAYDDLKGDPSSDPGEVANAKEELLDRKAAYDELQSEFNGYKAEYNKMKGSQDSTLDQLETAKDNAKLGMDTAAESFEITSNALLEEAQASAAAQLNALAVSMKSAVKQLQDTRVTSPISGVIEMKAIDVHDIASNSNPAYVVSNKDSMTVTFNVSSTAIAAMEVGDPVTVTSGSKEYSGAITEISTMVDQASGLFKVKASIENAQDLYTGMTVTLSANTQKAENAMIIPLSAVYYDAGKPYVYLNENNVAVKTYIETGIDNNEYIEVLSGLNPSSLVITSWDTNLIDGVPLAAHGTSSPADTEADSKEEAKAEPSEEVKKEEKDEKPQTAATGEPKKELQSAEQAEKSAEAKTEQPADSQPAGN